MNQLVYCGLVIDTEATYYKFTEGTRATIVTDPTTYAVEVTFPKGIYSKELGQLLGLKVTDDMEVKPTAGNAAVKINPTIFTLNGLELTKVTTDPHIIRIMLVDDYPSRVCQNYQSTTLVINTADRKDPEFIQYVMTNLRYIKVRYPRKVDWSTYELCNFPKLTILNSTLNLTSTNTYVHKLRSTHNRYLIKAIDYEHQFLHDLEILLKRFGVELARQNREETLSNTSYVSYSINQTPVRYNHPRYRDGQDSILCHMLAIDFVLSTPDMILFFDFKNKYNNVDFLTNYCEFRTKDKYGTEWTAAVKWGAITEEFNHLYSQDNNSNFANQCNFRAELYFYEVYDKNYSYINDIVLELKNSGMWDEDTKTEKGGQA